MSEPKPPPNGKVMVAIQHTEAFPVRALDGKQYVAVQLRDLANNGFTFVITPRTARDLFVKLADAAKIPTRPNLSCPN